MRYKQLIESKLELLSNLTMSFDSLISSNAPQQDMRMVNQRIKNLIEEIQSLISKES